MATEYLMVVDCPILRSGSKSGGCSEFSKRNLLTLLNPITPPG